MFYTKFEDLTKKILLQPFNVMEAVCDRMFVFEIAILKNIFG